MSRARVAFALVTASVALPTFALEPDQIYAKVAPSIVVVIGYNSSAPDDASLGSGVIIAPGQIVTNCHVVEGADLIYLQRAEVKTLGIVRYVDPDRDLCQIGATDITGFERAVPRIASTDELRVGQKVYAIGAPQGLELTMSDGLISSLRTLPFGTIIQTNAPVSKGSSGGGLFDSVGRLIGITSFIFKSGQNLNFAVPASWISELAERHKMREEMVRKGVEAEAAAQARAEEEQRREEAQHRKELERKQKEEAPLIWPTEGTLVYRFGEGANQKGIGITGKSGQPIVASLAGEVVYSGSGLPGYGKMIILKHKMSFLTIYANNGDISVKVGDRVNQGQQIGYMGVTDEGVQLLHFEVRRLGRPVDPLISLPKR